MICRKVAVAFVLMVSLHWLAFSRERVDSLSLRVMFYNVENLFDTEDDSIKDDIEFLPGGLMRWNKSRYYNKINSVAKVIIAAGEWNPPAIVGLCEIENRKVLGDLVYGTPLSAIGYGIVHEESPDIRGIDVCMLYRRDLVTIIDHRLLIPENFQSGEFHSRGVLYAKCAVYTDTLHVFVNHWPSRRGGVLAGEEPREVMARMVRHAADSLCLASDGNAKVLIIGDFNCTPSDPQMSELIDPDSAVNCSLTNLSDGKMTGIEGTYRYQGTWEMIDQIIVSGRLLDGNKGLATGKEHFGIFSPDFLLKNDNKYPGIVPFSTYRGYSYQGGFSDHLPVLLDLLIH
ncbi:MAG: endonuclease/exonuclease/phosphatase family protein [Bacteroidales bacterium]